MAHTPHATVANRLRRLGAHVVGGRCAQQQAAAGTEPEPFVVDGPALAGFARDGFLACPGLLSPSHVAALTLDFDAYMQRAGFSETHATEGGEFEAAATARLTQPTQMETLGALCTHRPLVDKIAALMAAHCETHGDALPTFSLHHQHALVGIAGDTGSDWHHDYEQYPQGPRDLLMCHCFVYLNGLNGEIGGAIFTVLRLFYDCFTPVLRLISD